jgi:hypothetical protein
MRKLQKRADRVRYSSAGLASMMLVASTFSTFPATSSWQDRESAGLLISTWEQQEAEACIDGARAIVHEDTWDYGLTHPAGERQYGMPEPQVIGAADSASGFRFVMDALNEDTERSTEFFDAEGALVNSEGSVSITVSNAEDACEPLAIYDTGVADNIAQPTMPFVFAATDGEQVTKSAVYKASRVALPANEGEPVLIDGAPITWDSDGLPTADADAVVDGHIEDNFLDAKVTAVGGLPFPENAGNNIALHSDVQELLDTSYAYVFEGEVDAGIRAIEIMNLIDAEMTLSFDSPEATGAFFALKPLMVMRDGELAGQLQNRHPDFPVSPDGYGEGSLVEVWGDFAQWYSEDDLIAELDWAFASLQEQVNFYEEYDSTQSIGGWTARIDAHTNVAGMPSEVRGSYAADYFKDKALRVINDNSQWVSSTGSDLFESGYINDPLRNIAASNRSQLLQDVYETDALDPDMSFTLPEYDFGDNPETTSVYNLRSHTMGMHQVSTTGEVQRDLDNRTLFQPAVAGTEWGTGGGGTYPVAVLRPGQSTELHLSIDAAKNADGSRAESMFQNAVFEDIFMSGRTVEFTSLSGRPIDGAVTVPEEGADSDAEVFMTFEDLERAEFERLVGWDEFDRFELGEFLHEYVNELAYESDVLPTLDALRAQYRAEIQEHVTGNVSAAVLNSFVEYYFSYYPYDFFGSAENIYYSELERTGVDDVEQYSEYIRDFATGFFEQNFGEELPFWAVDDAYDAFRSMLRDEYEWFLDQWVIREQDFTAFMGEYAPRELFEDARNDYLNGLDSDEPSEESPAPRTTIQADPAEPIGTEQHEIVTPKASITPSEESTQSSEPTNPEQSESPSAEPTEVPEVQVPSEEEETSSPDAESTEEHETASESEVPADLADWSYQELVERLAKHAGHDSSKDFIEAAREHLEAFYEGSDSDKTEQEVLKAYFEETISVLEESYEGSINKLHLAKLMSEVLGHELPENLPSEFEVYRDERDEDAAPAEPESEGDDLEESQKEENDEE